MTGSPLPPAWHDWACAESYMQFPRWVCLKCRCVIVSGLKPVPWILGTLMNGRGPLPCDEVIVHDIHES